MAVWSWCNDLGHRFNWRWRIVFHTLATALEDCTSDTGLGTLIPAGLVMIRLLFPSLIFVAMHVVVLAMVLAIIVSN
jgi:hypothetical protein